MNKLHQYFAPVSALASTPTSPRVLIPHPPGSGKIKSFSKDVIEALNRRLREKQRKGQATQ